MSHRYSIGAAVFEAPPLASGLYVTATPIGHLGDVTLRALETLSAAHLILCEDTRVTAKLLNRYGIRNSLSPYHDHNAAKVRPGLLARISAVSDLPIASLKYFREEFLAATTTSVDEQFDPVASYVFAGAVAR
jgi:16S rRNA (cytidine1402-2'-O)-methyltransferase